MSILTDWYPADVLPSRAGWYQREYDADDMTRLPDYFDGADWHHGCGSNEPGYVSPVARRWRGLAYNPSEV